jgi:hypothetical protein
MSQRQARAARLPVGAGRKVNFALLIIDEAS